MMEIPVTDTLSKWEAEAKKLFPEGIPICETDLHFYAKRILALIDLVRKKDEALMNAIPNKPVTEMRQYEAEMHEALVLTEELK